MVGTSKSRILAYEKGTSVPDPSRVFALANVFGVPTRELYEPSRGPTTLREMRDFACMTAAQVAAYIGVSRATYRDLEQSAIVPPRHTSTVLGKLAEALNLPPRMIERALDAHPAAQQRRREIADLLAELFDRAYVRGTPAVVEPDEQNLVVVAGLLRRPPTVAARLVNNEMNRLRRMLLNLAVQSESASYAQTRLARQHAEKQAETLSDRIVRYPRVSASNLHRFSAWALSGNEWRTLAQLSEMTYVHVSEELLNESSNLMIWQGLTAREMVMPDRERPGMGGVRTYVLTAKGIREARDNADRYGCLYPRIPSPRARTDIYRLSGRLRPPEGVSRSI
jgi:transcriptional regulator with XRE-family HTH domain